MTDPQATSNIQDQPPDRAAGDYASSPLWEQEYRDWLVGKYGHAYAALDEALEDGTKAVELFRDHVGHG